jgi:FkbM family methyltransferase
MLFRHALELIARNRKYWRRFPARYGRRRILVSPDAALRWLRPGEAAFERFLLDLADTLEPGMVVWDLGANVGVFAVSAAHRTGAKVVAIEPDPFLSNLLTRTCRANPDLDIDLVEAAVSDSKGMADLAVAGRGRACNALSAGHLPQDHGISRGHIMVPTTTLDDLLEAYPAPALLKIDIEGAELLALAGATRLLASVRPKICIEVRQETRAQAERILTANGYRFEGDENVMAVPIPDWSAGRG